MPVSRSQPTACRATPARYGQIDDLCFIDYLPPDDIPDQQATRHDRNQIMRRRIPGQIAVQSCLAPWIRKQIRSSRAMSGTSVSTAGRTISPPDVAGSAGSVGSAVRSLRWFCSFALLPFSSADRGNACGYSVNHVCLSQSFCCRCRQVSCACRFCGSMAHLTRQPSAAISATAAA